jgi:hypothetical protein
MQSERFHSCTIQNKTKFNLNLKFDFKISFELHRQVTARAIAKVAKKIVHFAWHGGK